MDTNFDSIDVANGYKLNGVSVPVTEHITVTVGTDFDTFAEAMTWAVNIPTEGSGIIDISLPAGTHLMPEPSAFDDWEWAYFKVTNNLLITGAAEATTFITMPDTDDGDNWPAMFSVVGGFLRMSEVTVDPSLGSYPYPENVAPGYGVRGGKIQCESCTFSSGNGAPYGGDAGYVFMYQCVIGDNATGLDVYGAGSMLLQSCTIQNCTTAGIAIPTGKGNGPQVNLHTVTFTNNTADTNVPINQIQYNGGRIANGEAALSFKA